jgi:hypothetical protein
MAQSLASDIIGRHQHNGEIDAGGFLAEFRDDRPTLVGPLV